MLVAEIHGKIVPQALNDEDFLTSAIFGHLRYVPPSVFWTELFKCAKSLPDENGQERSLTEVIMRNRCEVKESTSLQAHFWSRHPTLGEPDLLLCFRGEGPPLIILVEVKLWSGKSGTDDQLARYLNILDDLSALRPQLSLGLEDARRYLVYLTPRESLREVQESVDSIRVGKDEARSRVFRLQWQDVAEVARATTSTTVPPYRTILDDVARFLHIRGLEHFKGFVEVPHLNAVDKDCGRFYTPIGTALPTSHFEGWTQVPGLETLQVRRGEWTT